MVLKECAAAIPTIPACARFSHWQPEVSLEEGLARTYRWIEAQVRREPWTLTYRALRETMRIE